MADPIPIDLTWLNAHPLPVHAAETDKDGRGHVLAIGGSRRVPGGLRLTGEAALRSGAGRLQFATAASLSIPLGLSVPEAGVIALEEDYDGELSGCLPHDWLNSLERCDSVVVGPAMSSKAAAAPVVRAVLSEMPPDARIVVDAAAIGALGDSACASFSFGSRTILTPNSGEMAGLLGRELEAIEADPDAAVDAAVERLGATLILKGPRTVVATPAGERFSYSGGAIGLATGGSGDVLAGILAGLLARGTQTTSACAWAVWLHGEAGRRLTERFGPVGFLARELVDLIPQLMRTRL